MLVIRTKYQPKKRSLSLILTICALFGGKERFVLYYHNNIVFCLLAINQSINQFFCVFLTVRMFVLFPFFLSSFSTTV